MTGMVKHILDDAKNMPPNLKRGIAYLKTELKTLPNQPGVYRMQNEAGEVLYVGKARSLIRRVSSYTQINRLSNRIMRMVGETKKLEVIVTKSEIEALLLESNLIKKMQPRYNILLRDDKSLPQILLTNDHDFGQLTKHRGRKNRKGYYFGPFASAGSVNRTVADLSRAFMLRTCSDNIFQARTRPCLQYQIKRCSGPCVGLVNKEDYAKQLAQARQFLNGESADVQREYATRMHDAAEKLDFESAALWRNRIRALTGIQANQDINLPTVSDADIIAIARSGERSCIQIFFIGAGPIMATGLFPHASYNTFWRGYRAHLSDNSTNDKEPPAEIMLSEMPDDHLLLAQALSNNNGHKVQLTCPVRGNRRKVTIMALKNAEEALARHLANASSQRRLLRELATALGLPKPPTRIEIYDNSHIQGKHAVGGMVVAGPEGFEKGAYRRFNIKEEGQIFHQYRG